MIFERINHEKFSCPSKVVHFLISFLSFPPFLPCILKPALDMIIRNGNHNSDNPLWTESALKFYEEQELSMNVNTDGNNLPPPPSNPSPTDFERRNNRNQQLNIHNFPSSTLLDPNIPSMNGPGSIPHYSTLLDTGRAKLRQRMPDNSDVS